MEPRTHAFRLREQAQSVVASIGGPLLLPAFIAVLIILALQQTALLIRPLPWLLGVVPDDAFYYFQIARHLALGHGPTFDGSHPASGYHPAWMTLLVLLSALLHDPETFLRGALALEFVLHAATAAVLIGFFRRSTSDGVALIAGLCWLANPWVLLLSLQGVESGFYSLSLALLLRTEISLPAASAGTGIAPFLRFGCALALCFLARTEAVILATVTCVFLPALRGAPFWGRNSLRSSFLVAATFTACIAPWFVYCWMTTGSPWQTSGTMKRLWGDQLLGPMTISGRLERAVDVVGGFWLVPPWMSNWKSPFLAGRPIAWGGTILAVFGFTLAVRFWRDRRLIVWSAWLLTATSLTGLAYGLFFGDLQLWYRTQPALLLFVIILMWVARIGAAGEADPWGRFFRSSVLLMLLLLSAFKTYGFYRNPPVPYPWQPDVYTSQFEFEKYVPPDEAIGCFNAGIPAFFGQRQVVNLDGLVNVSVLPYYRNHELDRYFSDARIHYLADEELSLQRATAFMQTPLHLQPLASAPLHGWFTPKRWLWQVE